MKTLLVGIGFMALAACSSEDPPSTSSSEIVGPPVATEGEATEGDAAAGKEPKDRVPDYKAPKAD